MGMTTAMIGNDLQQMHSFQVPTRQTMTIGLLNAEGHGAL